MKDYSNGKIYCLRSHQTPDIYIGSTLQPLSHRMGNHKRDYKKWVNGKSNYVTSYEIMKYDDCYIEILEKYSCKDKMELERKEGEYIREMPCINKRIEGRKHKEYYNDNRDKILEYNKQHYQDNRGKISGRNKQYYQDNREKKLEQIKQHYRDNRGKILEQKKQYYQDNRDKLSEKITCQCGSVVSKFNLLRHKKSKKHQKFVNN
jgi:hypothetical protein